MPGVSPKASQTQTGASGASSEPMSALSTAGIIREPSVNSEMPTAELTMPISASSTSCVFVGSVCSASGQQASAEELQAHVKSKLAPYKYPRWVEFVPELPKTATGKIQRFKLRELEASRG